MQPSYSKQIPFNKEKNAFSRTLWAAFVGPLYCVSGISGRATTTQSLCLV
ncbi:hypothetical protein VCRA2116O29_310009 [Vibrio crassostreae]|nr:hypothetical protein VCRA2116O29_310009 [Vibrio crassostreae]CAK3758740.1 hypothetical protein VCRA2123O74_290063 [Vibrio crassostreae]